MGNTGATNTNKDPIAESTAIAVNEKHFLLKSGEKVKIPEAIIDENEFASLEGLKTSKEGPIPLHEYPHGVVRKHHLELLFQFYECAKSDGISKETPPTKIMQWAKKFFNCGGRDDLLPEMLLIGSYLVANTFVECALWYYASKMETMTIPQMRQYLSETTDFSDDEFSQFEKEEAWRSKLLEWGFVKKKGPGENNSNVEADKATQQDTKEEAEESNVARDKDE